MLKVGTKGIYIMMINVLGRRQNGLQEKLSQDKDNVPPSLDKNQQENREVLIDAVLNH
jgi:hypothetical protein